jgi:hypothetical protein
LLIRREKSDGGTKRKGKNIARLVGTSNDSDKRDRRAGERITSSDDGDQGRVRKQLAQRRTDLEEEPTDVKKRTLISEKK